MRISDWSSDVCSSDLLSRQDADGRDGRLRLRRRRGHADRRDDDRLAARPAYGLAILFPHRSEEHTSELQSLMRISYAVFCLKKKKKHTQYNMNTITPTQDT